MDSMKFNTSNGLINPFETFEEWVDLLENKSFEEIDRKIGNNLLDVNSILINGLTPLHIACIQGNYEAVTYLLKNKANRNIKSDIGRIPLDEAIFYGHKKCISALLIKNKAKLRHVKS